MSQELINEMLRSGRITADEAVECTLAMTDDPEMREFLMLLDKAFADTLNKDETRIIGLAMGTGGQLRFSPDKFKFIPHRRF